jgi:hypothetical protein
VTGYGRRNRPAKPPPEIKEPHGYKGQRPPGRIFTKWRFNDNGVRWEIPVRMIEEIDYEESSTKRRRPEDTGNTSSVKFGVFIEEPIKLNLTSTDIELLRKTVFDNLSGDMVWTPHYLISVESPNYYGCSWGDGVNFSYEFILTSVLPDGTKVWRRDGHYDGVIQKGEPRRMSTRRGEDICVIEATERNQKAIQNICHQFSVIRAKIANMFDGENVEATIEAALQTKLLPMPLDEDGDEQTPAWQPDAPGERGGWEYEPPEGVDEASELLELQTNPPPKRKKKTKRKKKGKKK